MNNLQVQSFIQQLEQVLPIVRSNSTINLNSSCTASAIRRTNSSPVINDGGEMFGYSTYLAPPHCIAAPDAIILEIENNETQLNELRKKKDQLHANNLWIHAELKEFADSIIKYSLINELVEGVDLEVTYKEALNTSNKVIVLAQKIKDLVDNVKLKHTCEEALNNSKNVIMLAAQEIIDLSCKNRKVEILARKISDYTNAFLEKLSIIDAIDKDCCKNHDRIINLRKFLDLRREYFF